MKKNKILIALLVVLGIVGRIIFFKKSFKIWLIPIDAFAFIAAPTYYLSKYLKKKSFLVFLLIFLISDIFINKYYSLFYDIGFLILLSFSMIIGGFLISLAGNLFKGKKLVYFSPIAPILYDLVTNFAFFLGPFYEHNLKGLFLCYYYAIPFMISHIITFCFFISIFYVLDILVELIVEREVIKSVKWE